MTQPITFAPTSRPAVWSHLRPLLLAVATTCRQGRTAELLLTLSVGLLQALGRRTVTQVLHGLGRGEQDWSAVYRQRRRRRRRRRDPTFWLVSAVPTAEGAWVLPLPLPVAELLAWAWQRWEVEVMHRELKSGLGLGQQQAWTPIAAVLVIQWVVWVSACLVLAGFLAWGWEQRGGGPR